MKKKILSFLLTICLVLPSMFFMTACDKGGDPENPPASPPADAPSTPPAETPGGTGPNEDAEFVYEFSEDGKFVYFGEFPQTIKADNVSILSEPPDSNGYYIGRDGERYYKHTVDIDFEKIGYDEETLQAMNVTKLSNGHKFSNGETLYFKVEKIKWRVLDSGNGEYLLMCDSILQGMAYQPNYEVVGGEWYATDQDDQFLYEQDGVTKIYANNYKYSGLRKFLTSDFYNQSFSESQKAMIKLTNVDNMMETTNNPSNNPYVCENTEDYVFALSYADMINTEYGFSADAEERDANRCVKTTDFAKATCALTVTEEFIMSNFEITQESEEWAMFAPYIGMGSQWLRSPDVYSANASHIAIGIAGEEDNATYPGYGAVPALKICLPH